MHRRHSPRLEVQAVSEGSLDGNGNGNHAAEIVPIDRFKVTGRYSEPPVSNKPRGLARRVRDVFGDDPTKLAQVLYDIALDDRAKPSDRITATRELWDRAYGKAPAHAPIEGGDPLEMTDLDRAIQNVANELVKRSHPVLDAEVIREEDEEPETQ